MNSMSGSVARIGMVKYINTAPIHEKWKQTVQRDDWKMIEAPPATLNRMLQAGEIDLGFVSCYEYGAHPEGYRILSGLSISANGPVGSVFLFSHVPIDRLNGKQVLLTAESETSVCLVKIILEEFHKVKPVYVSDQLANVDLGEFQAVLAIGDDALRFVEEATFLYQFDLGDMWKRKTGLPFVYAVCALRESFLEEHEDQLREIHGELLRCRDEGKEDLEAICAVAAPRIPMSKRRCYDYLNGIQYDLGAQKRKALETFFQLLISRGDIPKEALPLKLYSSLC